MSCKLPEERIQPHTAYLCWVTGTGCDKTVRASSFTAMDAATGMADCLQHVAQRDAAIGIRTVLSTSAEPKLQDAAKLYELQLPTAMDASTGKGDLQHEAHSSGAAGGMHRVLSTGAGIDLQDVANLYECCSRCLRPPCV